MTIQRPIAARKRQLGSKRLAELTVCAILFLLIAPNLFAEDLIPRFTVFGGGTFLKADRNFLVGTDQFRSNYSNAGRFGFRGTTDVTPHWAVEGTYSIGKSTLHMFNMSSVPLVPLVPLLPLLPRNFDVHVHEFSGDALYSPYSISDKVRVFAIVGLGLAHFSPTDAAKALALVVDFVDNRAAIRSSNSLTFNLGGGMEAKISSRFGIRFDFRDHIGGIPRFGVPQTTTVPGQDFYPVSGRIHDIESSVGFVFYPMGFLPSPR